MTEETVKDIAEIKKTLKNMQKSIYEIGHARLCEIDQEMNTILGKMTNCKKEEKPYLERRLNFLNKKYTDLFLTLHDPSTYSDEDYDEAMNEDYDYYDFEHNLHEVKKGIDNIIG